MSARRYAPPRALLPTPEELARRGRLHPHELSCLAFARHVASCDTCARCPEWYRPVDVPGPSPCHEGARLLRRWDDALLRPDAAPLLAQGAS